MRECVQLRAPAVAAAAGDSAAEYLPPGQKRPSFTGDVDRPAHIDVRLLSWELVYDAAML